MAEQIIQTEETLIIETPERVQLEFSLASIGNRFLAVAVDHFIQFFAIFSAFWLFFKIANAGASPFDTVSNYDELSKFTVAVAILVAFVLFAGYFAVFEWLWNGQTPGKRLLKLRVIREDGRPVTFWEALARNFLRLVDAFPGFIIPVYSLGLVIIFLNSRDQRIGDYFAGTVVVRERADEAPTYDSLIADPVSDSATKRLFPKFLLNFDVKKIDEPEFEVVEAFLRRRIALNERNREWMAWRVSIPLMYKLKPEYDTSGFTYEGFLEEVYARFVKQQKAI